MGEYGDAELTITTCFVSHSHDGLSVALRMRQNKKRACVCNLAGPNSELVHELSASVA